MNAERFTFYIKNPAHLYQITYTELKSLVLQYPYCQNLRYLLLKKSILENHKELDQNLQLAATFSTDRNFLYQQIKSGDSYVSEADNFLLKEDYLELKDLGSEVAPQEISNPPQQEEGTSILLNLEASTEAIIPEEVSPPSIEPEEEETENTKVEDVPKPIAETPEAEIIASEPREPQEFNELENIEEEDFVDITDEIEGLFEEQETDALAINATDSSNDETFADPAPNLDSKQTEESPEDEAISIEELIELDNMSPLERLEKAKKLVKEQKEHTNTETNEDDLEGMKNKEFDFEALDALIEKTKKDVTLEITNEDFLDVTEQPQEHTPSPKSSFGSWLKQFQSTESDQESKETFNLPEQKTDKPKKKKKKKKKSGKKASPKAVKNSKKEKVPKPKNKSDKPKTIAERSLEENAEIVSETLASLLVKQENYKKAIKMYEKLSLIFPEKSSFFAEQIKKLKNIQQ